MNIKEIIGSAISKLFTVKSFITIALTIVFCILSLRLIISSENFMTIFTVVISFYFGTQAEKAVNGIKQVVSKSDIEK